MGSSIPLMEIELVAAADLDAAFDDWDRLFRLDDLATPFNSSAWGRAWLEHWDRGGEPWLMRVRDGDRVAGIAPFALRRVRGVRLLGTVGKEPGDYWDVIAAPADRERVGLAVGAELARRRDHWDAGIISCLQPDSRTPECLEAAGLRVLRRPHVRSPALHLPPTFEEYLQSLPRSRRGNLRRHLRRLDRGEVTIREITDAAQVPTAMSRWRELRARQWRASGERMTPLHAGDTFHRFMVEAVTALLDQRLTALWELVHDGRVSGVYVNFADARTFYWYLGGFDPDLSRLGLGKIAIAASLRTSIEAGRRLYDFTRGNDAYKYWYGAEDRMLASVVLGHRMPRSRLALTAAGVLSRYRDRA